MTPIEGNNTASLILVGSSNVTAPSAKAASESAKDCQRAPKNVTTVKVERNQSAALQPQAPPSTEALQSLYNSISTVSTKDIRELGVDVAIKVYEDITEYDVPFQQAAGDNKILIDKLV